MSWGVLNAACLCSEKMAAKELIVPSELRLATVGKEKQTKNEHWRQLRVSLRGRREREEAQVSRLGSESLLIALGTEHCDSG